MWLCGYVDKFQNSRISEKVLDLSKKTCHVFPYLKVKKLTNFHFMVFDRYAIHIQAFLDFIKGKFIIFQSSPPHKYFQNMYSF